MNSLSTNPVLLQLAARQSTASVDDGLAKYAVRQCPLGKTRFATKVDARRRLATIPEVMSVFRCALCDGYHIGHRRGRVLA